MRKIVAPIAVMLGIVLTPTTASAVDPVDSQTFRDAVTTDAIMAHERALQEIANANGGTRASGTPGYTASAAYVKQRLQNAGYIVTEQTFTFTFYRQLVPAMLNQISPSSVTYETDALDMSGSGDVTGQAIPTNDVQIPPGATPNSSTSGCEAEDFIPASSTEPQVALIQRGGCSYGQKASNAQAAGYDAVIIFNEGQSGRQSLVRGDLVTPFTIPVVGLSFADGAALYESTKNGPTVVHVATSTEIRPGATTSNIMVETPGGDPKNVVVVGAHLDSSTAGPGIQDNGTSVSTLLEVARAFTALNITPRQKVRFAFWAGEERGMLGSRFYVNSLSAEQRDDLYAYLNFDMLGSRNYVRFIYDGDGSLGGPAGPPGSGQIEAMFRTYFSSVGLASAPKAFDGRSDYDPFITAGIPSGGLTTGGNGIKTAEEAAVFGGTAGAPYDPCVDTACDTIDNVNTTALREMAGAVALGVLALALTTEL